MPVSQLAESADDGAVAKSATGPDDRMRPEAAILPDNAPLKPCAFFDFCAAQHNAVIKHGSLRDAAAGTHGDGTVKADKIRNLRSLSQRHLAGSGMIDLFA